MFKQMLLIVLLGGFASAQLPEPFTPLRTALAPYDTLTPSVCDAMLALDIGVPYTARDNYLIPGPLFVAIDAVGTVMFKNDFLTINVPLKTLEGGFLKSMYWANANHKQVITVIYDPVNRYTTAVCLLSSPLN